MPFAKTGAPTFLRVLCVSASSPRPGDAEIFLQGAPRDRDFSGSSRQTRVR